MRLGPGQQYPIEWVLVREEMPVLVVGRFEDWRRIQDWEGDEGWVRRDKLDGTESLMVTGAMRTLRSEPDALSPAVARAEPGVIGRLRDCRGDWCRVSLAGYQGWLMRDQFWGAGSAADPAERE